MGTVYRAYDCVLKNVAVISYHRKDKPGCSFPTGSEDCGSTRSLLECSTLVKLTAASII